MSHVIHAFLLDAKLNGSVLIPVKRFGLLDFLITNNLSFLLPSTLAEVIAVILSLLVLPPTQASSLKCNVLFGKSLLKKHNFVPIKNIFW